MIKRAELEAKLERLKQSDKATNAAWRQNDENDYEDNYMHRAQSISKQIAEVQKQLSAIKKGPQ